MLVEGHRGYGSLAPHNSLAAFELAANDSNVTSVEFDVRLTRDGEAVVTHGPDFRDYAEVTTNVTAGGSCEVEDLAGCDAGADREL